MDGKVVAVDVVTIFVFLVIELLFPIYFVEKSFSFPKLNTVLSNEHISLFCPLG